MTATHGEGQIRLAAAGARVADAEPDVADAETGSVARRVVRQHWLAVALLVVGLALRTLAEISYRPAIFYIDTPRYLYDAQGMDPVGYKGPLRAILFLGNFDAVAAVQHLLGLAAAVALYVLLLRRGVPRWLAALAMAPILLDAYQVQAEQAIMPTVWFEALILAGLAILAWRPGTPGWRRVLAAGVLLGTSATFAQVGEALILPAMIWLLVAARAGGARWRLGLGKAALMAVACAVPILAYSAGSVLMGGPFQLSHSGITSFYGRMAAAADCATLKLPAAERGLCPTPAQRAQGPDWLQYDQASPDQRYYNNLPRARVDHLLSDFTHQVLLQQPLRVLGAYGHDLTKLFALSRADFPGDTPISRWQFQTYYPYFPPWTPPSLVRAAITQYGGGAPAVWLPGARFLRAYQLGGGYTPGPVFAVCVLAALAGAVIASRRRFGEQARKLALGSLLFFLSGAGLLLISDLFEFSWRYQLPALVTLVPAGALGIAAIMAARRERAT